MENKYQEGKIYKIICNITGEIYIGSTIQILEERLRIHKIDPTCISRTIIDRGDYEMILIKNYPCNSKEELLWEERRQLEDNICINIRLPIITEEEYKQNRKKINRKSYQENKETIKQKNKERYKNNKEQILEKNKEWKENNKEKLKENKKKYREENKEKILDYQKEKIKCDCGVLIRRGDIARHKKTLKHIKLMECIIVD